MQSPESQIIFLRLFELSLGPSLLMSGREDLTGLFIDKEFLSHPQYREVLLL